MVSVTVSEEEDIISALLQNFLTAKGEVFVKEKSVSGLSRFLLWPDTKTSCNVLLLHKPLEVSQSPYDITLLNADLKITPPDKNSLIITYGLNSLATITASSMNNDLEKTHFFCCLQRSIVSLSGNVIDPQEMSVILPEVIRDDSSAIAFVALLLLLSFTTEDLIFYSPTP